MAKSLYIIFAGEVNTNSANKLRQTIASAINEGYDELYFIISSGGGSVFEGIATASIINSLEIKTIMHNVGQIDSVANVIFASAKERYASQNASFMFHGVATPFKADTTVVESQMKERFEALKKDRERIAEHYSTYIGIPLTEVKELMVEGGVVLSATEAIEKKIISEIKNPIIPKDSKVVSIGSI